MTRAVSTTLPNCELTHLARKPIDVELARQQHHAYEELLRSLGVHVVSLPALDQNPDAVFVEDTAVVLDEVLVPARMGVASRAGEVFSVAEALAFHRRVLSLPPSGGATLEGGDVVRAWTTLYVGLTARTNQAGVDNLRSILEPYGYKVVAVPVRGCLHLKSACSSLGRNMMLVNSSWVNTRPLRGYEIVEVPHSEPGGANVLIIGQAAIVPTAYPLTQRLLHRLGFQVQPVELSELLKAEAGVTCESIVFETQATGVNDPAKTIR